MKKHKGDPMSFPDFLITVASAVALGCVAGFTIYNIFKLFF